MAKKTERARVLGYFIKADLAEAKALAEDVRLILRNRQPKVAKKGKKAEAGTPSE